MLIALCIRRLNDLGVSYNNITGAVGGGLLYIILITLTGDVRWAFLAGLAGIAGGGMFLAQLFGATEGGGDGGSDGETYEA